MNTITNKTPPIAAGFKPSFSSRNSGPPASNAPVAKVVIAINIPTRNRTGLVMNTFREIFPWLVPLDSPITEDVYHTTGTAEMVTRESTTKATDSKYWNRTPPRTGPNNPPIAAIAINFPACSPNLFGQSCEADAKQAVITAAPDAPCSNLAPARM